MKPTLPTGRTRALPSLLALLLLGATLTLVPVAQASGQCSGGSVTPTTWSPAGSVLLAPSAITVVFHATGPGYAAAVCDTGWISTCTLIVDGVTVTDGPPPPSEQGTTPMDCNGSGGYAAAPPSCSPDTTGCDVTLSKSYDLPDGTHHLEAIVGVSWGCCLWNGGPEAQGSVSWDVVVGPTPPGVDAPPVACFTHSESGATTTVDGSCSRDLEGGIASWSWDWGDGSGSDGGVTASHTYHATGNWLVTLTVTDSAGQSSSLSQVVYLVPAPCPEGVNLNTLAACGVGPLCPLGLVGTPGPGQLAVVCGIPVYHPCPQGVDALTARVCIVTLCPGGVVAPGAPGQSGVVCGVPVPCPPQVHANCPSTCSDGLTSPPGPADLAVVCGFAVPAPVGIAPACLDGVDNDGDGYVDWAPAALRGTPVPNQPGKLYGDADCENPLVNHE